MTRNRKLTKNRKHHHWETISRNWSNVGHPLRPNPDDSKNFAKLLKLSGKSPVRALILGVTPELYALKWPQASHVLSVDCSGEMIGAIWPGPAGSAFLSNWLELPFPDESFDRVLCDGGLHLLDYPGGQQRLAQSIARVLKPSGIFAIRLFTKPSRYEPPSNVVSDLRAGKIPNVNILKLRLAQSLQKTPEHGVVVGEVFSALTEQFGSLDGLQSATGWPQEQVATLNSYDRSSNCYHFLTEQQSVEVLCSGDFMKLSQRMESQYALGDRCPLLSFTRSE